MTKYRRRSASASTFSLAHCPFTLACLTLPPSLGIATVMQFARTPFLLAALSGAMVSGCVGSGDKYPSLAMRDVERADYASSQARPAEPVPPVISDSDIASIVARARGLNADFVASRPQTARIVATVPGTGPESEARSRALVALADLTSLHGQTALVLGELDRIEAQALREFAPIEAIRAAQQNVAQWVQQQDAALTDLESQLL